MGQNCHYLVMEGGHSPELCQEKFINHACRARPENELYSQIGLVKCIHVQLGLIMRRQQLRQDCDTPVITTPLTVISRLTK